MFEDLGDIDFGDDFTLDFPNKRPAEAQPPPKSKKPKIVSLEKPVIKRKFPGPAGILPDRKDFDWTVLENSTIRNEDLPCSQMSVSVFQNGPWLEMLNDFGPLVEKFDIKWIKKSANLNTLPNDKTPFLGAIIKNIECFENKNSIVKVALKDTSGEIHGTIIHSLYKEYSSSLVVGSVIVLRECGVLTTSYSSNHYITITPHNLLAVYENGKVLRIQELSCDELLAKSVIKPKVQTNQAKEKENVLPSCSQVIIKGKQEDLQIWENALSGVDVDSFFGEDF